MILVFNAGLMWRLRTDDTFLKEYVRTSPKAFIWRRMFGEERAAEIIRTRLVPLGIGLWTVLLLVLGSAKILAFLAGA